MGPFLGLAICFDGSQRKSSVDKKAVGRLLMRHDKPAQERTHNEIGGLLQKRKRETWADNKKWCSREEAVVGHRFGFGREVKVESIWKKTRKHFVSSSSGCWKIGDGWIGSIVFVRSFISNRLSVERCREVRMETRGKLIESAAMRELVARGINIGNIFRIVRVSSR